MSRFEIARDDATGISLTSTTMEEPGRAMSYRYAIDIGHRSGVEHFMPADQFDALAWRQAYKRIVDFFGRADVG